jgi:hypothetical protein
MHHPAISIQLMEIIPWLTSLSKLEKIARQSFSEVFHMLEAIVPKENETVCVLRSSLDCVIWKSLLNSWRELDEHDFKPPLRGRRLVGGLDSDVWVENPLMPDLMLSEKYVPYELATEGNSRSLGNTVAPFTMFTDPPFKPKARDVLCRLLKAFVLRDRLYYGWLETEYWKSTFEDQFPQMGVNKAQYSGRLGALRYDVPEMVDNTVVEDEDIDDFDASEMSHETLAVDVSEPHPVHGMQPWRVGPLAIAELDESQSMFDFSNFKSLLNIIRPLQLLRMARALKAS